MLARSMPHTVSIVGAGRVGRTLGKRLRESGWRVGAVVTRSLSTARAAVRAIGAGEPHAVLNCESMESDLVLLTLTESALPGVADKLASLGRDECRGKIVLHTSGVLDRTVLAPLAKQGASTGSLHPMQTFSGRAMPSLDGVIFGIEGDAKAQRMAHRIARELGGVPVRIDGARKPAYHAAAALVSGHALGLVDAATAVLMHLGFTRRRAVQALLHLMRQMLDNDERLGPHAAWTGPLSRGDYDAVAKHMAALREYPREFSESYAALALLSGRVLSKDPSATLKQLESVLNTSTGGQK
ncbi:MAG: Rossmann-like and DUF2520 domain-containing protein [Candidatus Acidiferrales bacterium]